MLPIAEGTEVLLKTGEFVTVMSGYSSWRGQRWTGMGRQGGKDIQKEFGEDDVRAVLGGGSGTSSRRDADETEGAGLF